MKKRRSKSESNKMAYQSAFSSVVPRRMQIYHIKLAAYQVKLLTVARTILLVLGASMMSLKFGKALQLTALIIPCVDCKYVVSPLGSQSPFTLSKREGPGASHQGGFSSPQLFETWKPLMKYKYPVISLLRSTLIGLDSFHKKKIS